MPSMEARVAARWLAAAIQGGFWRKQVRPGLDIRATIPPANPDRLIVVISVDGTPAHQVNLHTWDDDWSEALDVFNGLGVHKREAEKLITEAWDALDAHEAARAEEMARRQAPRRR